MGPSLELEVGRLQEAHWELLGQLGLEVSGHQDQGSLSVTPGLGWQGIQWRGLEDSRPGSLEAVCPHTHMVRADLTWGLVSQQPEGWVA